MTMGSSRPSQVHVLTLNCWGLKYSLAQHRTARLREIGRQIASALPKPNIVCLQELWAHDDFAAVQHDVRAILPHAKFYFAGAMGAGLAILSAWPLLEADMIRFPLNGRPTAFWRGDWYVGKGVAYARICAHMPRPPSPPDKEANPPDTTQRGRDDDADDDDAELQDEPLIIHVFNTHTHAAYASDPSDSYRVHRQAQAWTIAKLLRNAAEKTGHPLVIAAGDFNMTPLSTAHRIITSQAPVRDVWRVLHPDSSRGSWAEEEAALRSEQSPHRRRRESHVGSQHLDVVDDDDTPPPTAEFNLLENGVTSNSVLNTWRWSKADQAKLAKGNAPSPDQLMAAPDPRGKRLDYIFANTAARPLPGEAGVGGWVVKNARVTMTTRHPDLHCSLSDHFAVAATLAWHQTSKEDLALRGIDTTSLAGQKWPLPPGRESLFHAHHMRRKSTPALLHRSSDDDNNPNSRAKNKTSHEGEAANNNNNKSANDSNPDIHTPMGGAFLSLQSPTPSTSRLSLPNSQRHNQLPPLPASADYDTQLLSSLSPGPLGDLTAFEIHDYDALLADLQAYVAREANQTRWRTCHFLFWLYITISCYIITWFVPTHNTNLSLAQSHAIHFVLLLLSSLGLVAGVLDGLMALLFFRGSEKRALYEFQWDLTNARALAHGQVPAFTSENRVAKH